MGKYGFYITVAISIISLGVAIISLIKASRAQNIQNKVNELDLKIKAYELKKIENEKEQESKECVEARIIRVSSQKQKLKVWNSGNVTVYNVSASIDKEAQIIVFENDKMPFDELEPGKSFEVPVVTHFGSLRKFRIKTSWDNEKGEHHEKVMMGDI